MALPLQTHYTRMSIRKAIFVISKSAAPSFVSGIRLDNGIHFRLEAFDSDLDNELFLAAARPHLKSPLFDSRPLQVENGEASLHCDPATKGFAGLNGNHANSSFVKWAQRIEK